MDDVINSPSVYTGGVLGQSTSTPAAVSGLGLPMPAATGGTPSIGGFTYGQVGTGTAPASRVSFCKILS